MNRGRAAGAVLVSALALAVAAPASAPAGGASHAFSFVNPKLNKKKGTAVLPVNVSTAGLVSLAQTPEVRGSQARAPGKAQVRLAVRPRGAAKRRLAKKGTTGVRLTVTYTPDGGKAKTQSLTAILKLDH